MSIFKKLKYKVYVRSDIKRRLKIIDTYKIDLLFDIGASTGQYATKMRELGYKNKIVSFEPLNDIYIILNKAASRDKNWVVNNYALGDKDQKSIINVAGNSVSSSLLNMLPKHVESDPESKFIAQQEIEIKRMDTIFTSFYDNESRVMVKIDAQGFEKNIIDGGKESLNRIIVLQIEMSIVPLYENEILYIDMINYMENNGFQLFSLESGHYNRNTGQLLQVDGIFVNKNMLDSTD